jgi:hypothetical protein
MSNYSARLMFMRSYGLLPKEIYNYFRNIDEPDYYFYKMGKKPLEFWEKEFKEFGLYIETELNNIIHLVKRDDNNEVVIGIRLVNYDAS